MFCVTVTRVQRDREKDQGNMDVYEEFWVMSEVSYMDEESC